MKICADCDIEKPLSEYYDNGRGRPYSYCKPCARARQKDYYERNAHRHAERQRNRRAKARQEALDAYGGACACCGEGEPAFLAIDHVDGGGNDHRREIGESGESILRWLRDNNYPEGFQLLCHNCNMATSHGRVCPHKRAGAV